MGLTRKILSLSTLGAIDMRSDKERTAAYAKETKKQTQAQTKLMQEQARRAAAPMQDAAPAMSPTQPDVMEQLRQLGQLRDTGVLTAAEFESKKAELLSRL